MATSKAQEDGYPLKGNHSKSVWHRTINKFGSSLWRSPCLPVIASFIAALVLVRLAVLAAPALYHLGQNGYRAVSYKLDPVFIGRDVLAFPAPVCCEAAACSKPKTSRVAALTYIRTEKYFPLLQQLECTVRSSNPGLELVLMYVKGELSPLSLKWAERRNLTLIQVPDLSFPNSYAARYGRNWLKIRAYGLTQYDAVLILDTDVAVVGDLSPLFSLPTDFAASWDQTRQLGSSRTLLQNNINGGVLLIRPCQAVEQHMLTLLEEHPKLQFVYGAAEQDFFTWYYRYTGWMLPLKYNTMASDSLVRGSPALSNLTVGGHLPVVVHYTQHKPFSGRQVGMPGHQFLCSQEELQERL